MRLDFTLPQSNIFLNELANVACFLKLIVWQLVNLLVAGIEGVLTYLDGFFWLVHLFEQKVAVMHRC